MRKVAPQAVPRFTPGCPHSIPRLRPGCPHGCPRLPKSSLTGSNERPFPVDESVDNLGTTGRIRWTAGGQPMTGGWERLIRDRCPQSVDKLHAQIPRPVTCPFASVVPTPCGERSFPPLVPVMWTGDSGICGGKLGQTSCSCDEDHKETVWMYGENGERGARFGVDRVRRTFRDALRARRRPRRDPDGENGPWTG